MMQREACMEYKRKRVIKGLKRFGERKRLYFRWTVRSGTVSFSSDVL